MKEQKKKETYEHVWKQYQRGLEFNTGINLNDTVEVNENFFIGKQWEGVVSNGLPTPVFNFLKRVVMFTVASITSDNLRLNATPLAASLDHAQVQRVSDVVNHEFERLFNELKIVNMLREYMRNAAVDGDGCIYTYWDADAETGIKNAQGNAVKGAIRTEIVENNRVFFGNPNDRRVCAQPYILITFMMPVKQARKEAAANGIKGTEQIVADGVNTDITNSNMLTDDKLTVILKLWKADDGTIHGFKCCRSSVIRDEWSLGIRKYPVTWLNWDYVQNCYHGQAMLTGLIPNQIFINKLFAMSMISLMTTAYPKIVYDATRVAKWDNRVGAAIGINGGDVNSVAKIIDPAQISPQIAQFIELAVNYTQTFLGATPAALGDTRPDNTSAIIALQRAAATPSEITRQNLYQSLHELGEVFIEFMASNYGERMVKVAPPENTPPELLQFAQVSGDLDTAFNFDELKEYGFMLKLDVGASSYWSEIASMQTLDNLLMQGKIDIVDYLDRVPDGYITKREELLEKLRGAQAIMSQMQDAMGGAEGTGGAPSNAGGGIIDLAQPDEIHGGGGYAALQRKINQTGEVPV